ncbi:hypothetical protein CBQ26_00310 [Deinococcus indicus]|uniref:Uncharacterized protein n=1 Tax=Deinococcus indicus TaxID=223556 RepID=A0A246BTD1_9DEIO|nr:hypothetical protein CBQ26_00310 [Deinococcus indicus]
MQAALAVKACPPVYVDIVNPSGRVSYRRWSDHPDVQEALGTQGYSVRRSDSQYELEGEPHPLRALLAETAAALASAEAERDALREALGTIGAGVEIARQQGNGNAHMDAIYRIACEAMGVQS